MISSQLFIFVFKSILGTIGNKRKEELAIQAIQNKEAAELKAAKKAAEDAGIFSTKLFFP